MLEEIRIYIEGDTNRQAKNTDITLRQGFHYFFRELIDEAKTKNIRVRPIPYGSKFGTFKKFLDGLRECPESSVLFLIDSDAPLNDGETPKAFLQRQNPKWHLRDVEESQCNLMVQVMESWFFADIDLLEKFYGQNFLRRALAKNRNVERISKADVETGLTRATEKTQKGAYHKTRHAPKLLELIDPKKVCESAPTCQRLFEVIRAIMKAVV